MTSEDLTTQPGSGTSRNFWFVFLGIAGAALLFTFWLKNSVPRPHSGLAAGETAPTMRAVGWVNGEAPLQTPAPGTYRVLHAWFTTCPACYRESKELVKLHQEYESQGVEFVGLTFEPPDRLKDVNLFLEKTGVTWVNGYGAGAMLKQLGVEYFPSVWIINDRGEIVWSRDSKQPLEEAIPLAIAGKLPTQIAAKP